MTSTHDRRDEMRVSNLPADARRPRRMSQRIAFGGPRILILCSGNSCRSQMAEAFLRYFDSRIDVHSAGTRPARSVHPLAVKVMLEAGIDLSECRPKDVSRFVGLDFDYVITVCDGARDECPAFTGNVKHRLHFSFDDPVQATGTDDEVLEAFRKVRDGIRNKLYDFCWEYLPGWPF